MKNLTLFLNGSKLIALLMAVCGSVVVAQPALALEAGCRLQPSQIEEAALAFQNRASDDSTDMNDSLVIHTGVEFNTWNLAARPAQRATRGKRAVSARSASAGTTIAFNYEAFLRPSRNDFFGIPGFPLLGARLTRMNDVVYVCAHSNPQNHAEDHVTVYFLHGKDLGDESITQQIGNVFTARGLHVAPLQVSILAIGAAPTAISGFFEKIPLLNIVAGIPVAALQTINRTLGQSLAFVGGAGVERVTVTPTKVELASRVNLLQPRQARILMNLPLNGLTQAAR